ncbi:MAG: group III truncated hemoglobin [Reyranella sp.]|nr:group III truncated hemoglobin [Reyranella sp.]
MTVESLHSAERRAQITADIVARTGIDTAMIQRLVTAFYARAREDALLGPVFGAHIIDWDAHLARMCSFWASVALMSGSYHGNPMSRHLGLPVDALHFDRWLALFEETATAVCPPAATDHFIERARRIAQSLELGIASVRGVRLGRGQRFRAEDLAPPPSGDQP